MAAERRADPRYFGTPKVASDRPFLIHTWSALLLHPADHLFRSAVSSLSETVADRVTLDCVYSDTRPIRNYLSLILQRPNGRPKEQAKERH